MSAELDRAKQRIAELSQVRADVGPDRWVVDALQNIIAHLEKTEPPPPAPRPRFVPSERVK